MKITLHTALITGSSRGFGRAIAVKLAQEGVKKIAVHYLTRRDEAEKTVSHIREAGAEGVLVQGDTSDAKRAGEIVEEAAEKLGGCDIFVQSVIPTLDQIYEHTLATEVPLAKWQIAFDTQARAFFVGAPAAAKHMSPGGRILALLYTGRIDRRMAALGRYGFRQGGGREHVQVLRGCARAPRHHCERRQPGSVR